MSEVLAFTVEDVVEQVRALAAERPHYIYRPGPIGEPSYVTGQDGYGCIVGQALERLGVSTEVLRELESWEPGGLAAESLLRILLGDRRTQPTDAVWIAVVQQWQDRGLPRGEAVARADAGWAP